MNEKLLTRQFLNWDEAAEVLGFDIEGLRQAMLGDFNSPNGENWLPVIVDSRGEDFLTHLQSRSLRVVEKCLNYDEHAEERDATFDDGSTFEASGKTLTASWEATHDHRSGWSMCFRLAGRLVLNPSSVRDGCQNGGDLRRNVVLLEPREWWGDGMKDTEHSFMSIGGETSAAFRPMPQDIFKDTLFYAADVMRVAQSRKGVHVERGVVSTQFALRWPWGDHDTDLLQQLSAAANQWWSTYDPNDPTTAPKNREVVDWLQARGVSKRIAENIATMLRPADVRTGPR